MFSLKKSWIWGHLIEAQCLWGGEQGNEALFFPVVHGEIRRDDKHKVRQPGHKKEFFPHEDRQAGKQAVQGGFAISGLVGDQELTEQNIE